jgi:ABC-2 type transport system permease protein
MSAAAGLPLRDVETRNRRWRIFSSTSWRADMEERGMNLRAIAAIYRFEMGRTFRTLGQSLVSPVLTTSLYFVVFGAAIGSRIEEVEGVSYGAFIVPGLIMLTVMTQAISNASFGIYFPKFIGTIYELLSAPVSFLEIVRAMSGGGDQGAVHRGGDPRHLVLFVDLTILHPFCDGGVSWC